MCLLGCCETSISVHLNQFQVVMPKSDRIPCEYVFLQIICPFMLDQFYWAEKMSWLGVAPQPLERNHLILEEPNDENIMEAAQVVAKAIYDALSTKTRARAMEIAEILSLEVTSYNQFITFHLLIHGPESIFLVSNFWQLIVLGYIK